VVWAGTIGFVAAAWPEGRRDHRLRRMTVLGWAALAAATVRYVSRHVRGRPDPGAAPLHLLGLFLGAEVAFGVLVIVHTGTLVDAPVA
jgi:hypothetical protein